MLWRYLLEFAVNCEKFFDTEKAIGTIWAVNFNTYAHFRITSLSSCETQ